MENEYYYIKISNFWFVFWIIFGILLIPITLFCSLIAPVYYFFVLRKSKYYYNNNRMIVEYGVFKKRQYIIPLYRITNITAEDNIFNFGRIYIQDKEQIVVLKYVKHSKGEMLKLTEIWEEAKKQNLRNEVF